MTKPTLSFFFDTRRELKDGTYPVKLTVYFLGKKIRYATPFKFTQEEYAKIEASNLRDARIKKLKNEMYAWLGEQVEFADNLKPFSFNEFDVLINKDKVQLKLAIENESVKDLFEACILDLRRLGHISTSDNYHIAMVSLLKFKKHLKISQVTVDFLKAYEQYMIAEGKSISTVGIYLRSLRRVFNLAIEAGTIESSKYPFRKYKIPAPKKLKRSLKKEDVKKIINYKPKLLSEQKALDYWIFSFLCNGMNFKDIALLTNKKIKGNFIEFYRSKTENTTRNGALPIRVPISPRIIEIMNRRKVGKGKPDDYIFPVLEKGMDLVQIEKRISTFIRNTNKPLKRIGIALDLPLKLTTYVARHCFATIQKNNGAPLVYIKEALGHATISQTEDYFGSFDDESLINMHEGLMLGLEE
jgi:integrase